MKAAIILLLIVMGFVKAPVANSAVIDTSLVSNSYCTADGKASWKFKENTSTTSPKNIDFDEVGAYRDPLNGDSVPIFVKYAVGTDAYKFITVDKNTLEPTERICSQATIVNGYSYVALMNQFLILTNVNGNYYFCHFDPKSDGANLKPQQLEAPIPSNLAGPVTLFYPINAAQRYQDVFVVDILWGDATARAFIQYTVTYSSVRDEKFQIISELIGSVMNDQSPIVLGNNKFIYHAGKNRFQEIISGNWVDMNLDVVYPTDYTVVKSYRFHQNAVVLDIPKSSTEGRVMLIALENVYTMQWTSATTTPYIDYCDGVSNFMRFGSANTLWFTWVTSAMNSPFTEIPTSELTIAGQDIVDIALSGNIATIFYTSTIRYLKHAASKKIEQLFSKSVTSTDLDLTKTSLEFAVIFNCMCISMKRFACFSSTLNCMIVKKGMATCSSEGSFFPLVKVPK